jgi:hypothetical protein
MYLKKKVISKNVMESISKDFSFVFNATQDRKAHTALSFQIY